MMIAIPATLVIQGDNKQVGALEVLQGFLPCLFTSFLLGAR